MNECKSKPIARYMRVIGMACRKARKDHNVSVMEIANATRMEVSTVYKFEVGKTMSYVLLVYYVAFLGVDILSAIGGKYGTD